MSSYTDFFSSSSLAFPVWVIGVCVAVAIVLLIVGVFVGMVISRKWKYITCKSSKEPVHTYEDVSELAAYRQNRPIAACNPQQAEYQKSMDSPQQGNIEVQENIAYRPVAAACNPQHAEYLEIV